MRFILLSLCLLFTFFPSYCQICESVGSGQWNSAGTWSCDGAATIPDGTITRVLIRPGNLVQISNYDAVFNGELAVFGSLGFTDQGFGPFSRLLMDATSVVDIHNGGSISVDNPGTCFCRIGIGGSFAAYSPLFGVGNNPQLGPVSISEAGFSATLLPIELVDFECKSNIDNIELKWSTISEINFSHFEIEKSTNGEDFYTIGKVNGFGESTELRKYSFDDNFPITGNNFYRLKQVDHDGTFEHSEVILQNQTQNIGNAITVYPNPVKNSIISLNLNFVPSDDSRLSIYDNLGRVVHEQPISGFSTSLDLTGKLSSQFYILKIESSDRSYFGKFVKE